MFDTITVPRVVVEQALEALDEADLLMEHRQNIELRRSALVALRAALEQPQVEQEPIRWPANASEVRAFLSGHVAAERYARDDHQPDDSDTYTLSAHDLLGAIYWWTDFDPQPPRQPLTDQQIHDCFQHRHRDKVTERRMITRSIEFAHGITGEQA